MDARAAAAKHLNEAAVAMFPYRLLPTLPRFPLAEALSKRRVLIDAGQQVKPAALVAAFVALTQRAAAACQGHVTGCWAAPRTREGDNAWKRRREGGWKPMRAKLN